MEESRDGVEGLIESGVMLSPSSTNTSGIDQLQVPVIDLQGINDGRDGARRTEIVVEICKASETWGFFQMINHGVPVSVMSAVLEGVRRFHLQPQDAKMDFYSSRGSQKVKFYPACRESDAAQWKDVLSCTFQDDKLDLQELPHVCRKEMEDYANYMIKLRKTLLELLSEALGSRRDFLSHIKHIKSQYEMCLHYPVFPEPDLTLALARTIPEQSDPNFLTILLQDSTGDILVLHQNHWLDVPPIPGALIANLGDYMELIASGKLKSVKHIVVARSTGIRISAACFIYGQRKGIVIKKTG